MDRRPSGGDTVLCRRLFTPATVPSDRGRVAVEFPFTLAEPGEVELFVGPGPSGRDARDWAGLGPLKIE